MLGGVCGSSSDGYLSDGRCCPCRRWRQYKQAHSTIVTASNPPVIEPRTLVTIHATIGLFPVIIDCACMTSLVEIGAFGGGRGCAVSDGKAGGACSGVIVRGDDDGSSRLDGGCGADGGKGGAGGDSGGAGGGGDGASNGSRIVRTPPMLSTSTPRLSDSAAFEMELKSCPMARALISESVATRALTRTLPASMLS